MKNKLKRLLAVIIASAFLLPNGNFYSFAAETEQSQESQDNTEQGQQQEDWSMSVKIGAGLSVNENEETIDLNKDSKSHTYNLDLDNKNKKLKSITIKFEDETKEDIAGIELNSSKLTDSNNILTATLEKFPAIDEQFKLTITANDAIAAGKKYNISITAETEPKEQYYVSIEKGTWDKATSSFGSDTDISNNGKYYENSTITFSVKPDEGYSLVSFKLSYGADKKTQTITSSVTKFEDWNITWSSTGETKVVGKLNGDIVLSEIVTEEIPKQYTVKIKSDTGVTVSSPSSSSITVTEGQSVFVRASAKTGYLFNDCLIQSGKSYGSWVKGQNFLTLGNTRIEVTDEGDRISFTIPDIYEDITVNINSTFDEDNIPIQINEGSRIDIYTESSDTVSSGSDAMFYISTTSDDYVVNKITLKVGSESKTVDADNGEIIVGNKNYRIDDMGGGVYALIVDNITEPITVSATSASTSSSTSKPSISISASSNVKITKSTNSYYVNSGDSVYFYFTPYTNYQISEITLTVGNLSKTVSSNRTSVTVGNNTYTMSRSSSGVVTLYVTNITQNVKVSAASYFTRDDVTATTSISINKNSRNPFITGYSDGTFRPKDNMTKAEAVSMLYKVSNISNISYENVFSDVPNTMWCASQINTFANAGIIDKTNYFYPNNYITRAEMTELIYRLAGSPQVTSSNVYFLDISNTQSNSAIRYCASQGWINGYPDNTFRPYNYMTRDEVVTMMCRVLNRTYGNMSQRFSDVSPSYWAYSYIQMACSYI